MPDFCELATDVILCPMCGSHSDVAGGVIKFQWGKIPKHYKLGDSVVWLKDKGGNIVPPFKIIERRHWLFGFHGSWNFGEPQYENLYAFEDDPYYTEHHCSVCTQKFEAIAAEIIDGRFVRGVAFGMGDIKSKFGITPQETGIILVMPDGSYKVREDWNDPPFSISYGF